MRRFLLIALLLSPGSSLAQPDAGVIALGVGEQKVLQLADVSRVAIGEPEIADVKQVGGGSELLVTGLGQGRTSLLVWRRNRPRLSYLVTVRAQDPKELVSEVRALLGDREGVQVRVVGENVYLEGETLTPEDTARVQEVAQLFPAVRSFVRPSANARKLAAGELNRELGRLGLSNVTATVAGDALLLEGTVESDEEMRKVELLARSAGEKPEVLVAVAAKRMVLVEVDFLEVTAGSAKVVGVKPPSSIVSTGDGATASVSVLQPIRALDSGQTEKEGSVSLHATAAADFSLGARFDDGKARALSRPRLLCASGEKAEFLAGGEVPLLMATQNQFSVEFKKFGVLLQITPTADARGNIATTIYAEVSDVDHSISVRSNGIEMPGFKVRNLRTSVTVRDGQTIVLSGLYGEEESKEVSKVPLLGHIPILGELFKSRSFLEHRTELAVTVTPRLIAPSDGKAKEMLDRAHKSYKEAGESVSFSVFD
ncbi:MAG TPA: pilus assembly protein N-terminal domain-containing protein [Myxococcales bacterium]|nr:pilus assembly protein N-terminal domain-containing protein [Myxococcales bacterium]